jgi:hypothetical protein
MTRYEIRQSIKHLDKPEKQYGHAHYERVHLIAVVEYATAMAQEKEDRDGLGS